jgi:nitroreductase
MDFSHLASSRFSVRKFKKVPVEKSKILMIMDTVRIAPSAVNFQPWYFIVITQPDKLEQLTQSYPRNWIKEAPMIIVACADHTRSWKRGSDGKDFADVDLAIAIDHLTLKAVELGLGTCWVCNFDPLLCRKNLNLPAHIEPVALIPIGYPDIDPPTKTRKKITEIICWEDFGNFSLSEDL